MALPTTKTTASQPVTGNGSLLLVVLDEADELLELLQVEAGLALLLGEVEVAGRRRGRVSHPVTVRDPSTVCNGGAGRLVRLRTVLPQRRGDPDNVTMARQTGVDALDARLIALFTDDPHVGVLGASRALGVARGTVQARLDRLQERGVVKCFAPEVDPAALGYPVTAFCTLEIRQRQGHAPVVAHLVGDPRGARDPLDHRRRRPRACASSRATTPTSAGSSTRSSTTPTCCGPTRRSAW